MKARDLKYLAAYIIPVLVFLGLTLGGFWIYSTIVFAFGLVPVLEHLLQKRKDNFSKDEKLDRLSSAFFDVLLYLNVPIVFLALYLFARFSSADGSTTLEMVGMMLSMGILLAANGINVAHELGHRNSFAEQKMAHLLLLPSFYMHFFIEHNRGHHRNVATPEDPSSARLNEGLYEFWWRAVRMGYTHAWQLENDRLRSEGRSVLSLENQMIRFSLYQLLYLVGAIWLFGWYVGLQLLMIGIISFLFLESINYVEHYGLSRSKNDTGTYERVDSRHSWNSNHEMGRIILYELTRHSDHHFKANKKYQILEHHDNSPQLPYGYPSSILLSLIPGLWKAVMNKEVEKYT